MSTSQPNIDTPHGLTATNEPASPASRWPAVVDRIVRYILALSAVALMVCLAFSFQSSAVESIHTATEINPVFDRMLSPSGGATSQTVPADKLTVQMAVALEYESMAIRTKAIQMLYGMMVGIILCVIGVAVLATGIEAPTNLSGGTALIRFNAATAAPGSLLALAGAVLMILAIQKEMGRDLSVDVLRDTGTTLTTRQVQPKPLTSVRPEPTGEKDPSQPAD